MGKKFQPTVFLRIVEGQIIISYANFSNLRVVVSNAPYDAGDRPVTLTDKTADQVPQVLLDKEIKEAKEEDSQGNENVPDEFNEMGYLKGA